LKHTPSKDQRDLHFYPFGLKIAAISSRKFGDSFEGLLKNNNLYNDKEFFDDADLNWYDYGFRNYDPQIGRFVQIDPLSDDYGDMTPYHYAANDPIGNEDKDGLGVISSIGMVACWSGQSMGMVSILTTLGAVANVIGIVSDVLNVAGKTGDIVNRATTLKQINGSIKTQGVGQKSLDGNRGLSSSDLEKKDKLLKKKGKEINEQEIVDEFLKIIADRVEDGENITDITGSDDLYKAFKGAGKFLTGVTIVKDIGKGLDKGDWSDLNKTLIETTFQQLIPHTYYAYKVGNFIFTSKYTLSRVYFQSQADFHHALKMKDQNYNPKKTYRNQSSDYKKWLNEANQQRDIMKNILKQRLNQMAHDKD